MTIAPAPSAEARSSRLTVSLSGTNLERAADYNQRVVLQAIRIAGEASRNDLVQVTGLTPPTIANITRRLVRDGLIRETGRVAHGRGQPAVRLAVNPDGAFGIGLSVDGERLSIACLDLAGEVRWHHEATAGFPAPAAVRAFMDEAIGRLHDAGVVQVDRIVGTGIVMPDAFGHIGAAPATAAAWHQIDPATLIAGCAPGAVYSDNDAAAAALAELHFGAGRGRASFFCILFCTGFGAGMVADGTLYRGATGHSGEIGHLPLGDGGTLEQRVSLTALYARLAAAGCPTGSLQTLLQPAPAAERVIAAWIEEAAELLVAPLIAINCLVNPELILVGGLLPQAITARLVTRLERLLAERARHLPALAPVRAAALGERGPTVGAALLPFLDRLLPSDAILMNAAP